MPKPKTDLRDDPAQSERFIEAAKTDGIEEVGEAFKQGFKRLVPTAKHIAKTPPRKTKRAKRA